MRFMKKPSGWSTLFLPAFEKKLVEKLGDKDTVPMATGWPSEVLQNGRKKGLWLLSEAEPGTYRVCERLRTRPQAVGLL